MLKSTQVTNHLCVTSVERLSSSHMPCRDTKALYIHLLNTNKEDDICTYGSSGWPKHAGPVLRELITPLTMVDRINAAEPELLSVLFTFSSLIIHSAYVTDSASRKQSGWQCWWFFISQLRYRFYPVILWLQKKIPKISFLTVFCGIIEGGASLSDKSHPSNKPLWLYLEIMFSQLNLPKVESCQVETCLKECKNIYVIFQFFLFNTFLQ